MIRRPFALLGLLLGAAVAQAQAPPTNPTARIVVQSAQSYTIDVAAWTRDSRFLFTAEGESRELVLWDIERGVIVDRVTLPGHDNELRDDTDYTAMRLSADGKTLHLDGKGWTNTLQPVKLALTIDTASRAARLQSVAEPVLDKQAAQARRQAEAAAWLQRHSDTPDAAAERADLLRTLPASPNGRWQPARTKRRYSLQAKDGTIRQLATPMATRAITSAALSPNRQMLAISRPAPGEHGLVVEIHDLLTGTLKRRLELPNGIRFIGWGDDRYFTTLSSGEGRDGTVIALAEIIDSENGVVMGKAPSTCMMTLIPHGPALGTTASWEQCLKTFPEEADYTTTLARLSGDEWKPLEFPPLTHFKEILAQSILLDIVPSQRGEMLALNLADTLGQEMVMLFDGNANPVSLIPPLYLQRERQSFRHTAVGFSPGAKTLWISRQGAVLEWPLENGMARGEPRRIAIGVQQPALIESNGRQLLVAGQDGRVSLVNVGAAAARLELTFTPNIKSVGFLPDRPIIWAVSPDGLRLWDSRTGAVLLTSHYVGDGFVTVAADGRYDTNLGPDSQAFRWLLPKSPFQSLAPQTFMRDYFEPDLARKLIDCTTAGSCAQRLKPVRPFASINTLLPEVEITRIAPAGPGQADVEIAITEQVAKNGKRSGAFRASLQINNREVARNPDLNLWDNAMSLEEWRLESRMDGNRQGRRTLWRVRVEVPTDGKPMEFSAYAFNSDRVKSDTARALFTPPPAPPRPRRAFVVTIGVDHYAEPRLALNFAVSDAKVIAGRLAQIPGFEMRHASLTTGIDPDGKQRSVDYYDLRWMFNRLSGNRETSGVLTETRHDLSALDRATPDDIVIISYSGHGYTDPTGTFALLTSETHWPAMASAPEPLSIISSNILLTWLRYINAGEIALIIDACHSGALVSPPDFKPGPMGDNGLAQTAYDKGIRILAATQADDVALESSLLRQGFLTAALGEGLTDDEWPADLDLDENVRLDEWLRYAVDRLPSLEAEVRRGGGPLAARGVRLVMRSPGTAPRKSQVPSLFDFNASGSSVILRGKQ
ncbi:caspase family protein [Sandarakinorhabdus sp. AAP62]|uniref:caspase family protein n=1 Tax=Sandarakinorhabdus sp. AAP62 TaxID=1248916 RepID=UPI0002D5AB83|nr:caspase family protein [Sandarakinorhabdus sp. AAP62]